MNSTNTQNMTMTDVARLLNLAYQDFHCFKAIIDANVEGKGRTTVTVALWSVYEVTVGDDALDRLRNTHDGDRVIITADSIELFSKDGVFRVNIENVHSIEVL